MELAAWILAILVSIPLLVLATECLVARVRHVLPAVSRDRPPCVILIPAHDEESGLGRTLKAIAKEVRANDRVLVIADNCTDQTADIARDHAVEVIERTDPDHRGKGYALAFGIEALRSNPLEVVIILDADCVMSPGSLSLLVERTQSLQRPVQAAYRMIAPLGSGGTRCVAEFAFLVKNVVRPLGLRRLGLPCLLMGTGMAFPWTLLCRARLGHGHIVEDMQLAVDLAAMGHEVEFVPEAEAWAEFPAADTAASTQRRRWEHGHLKVLLAGVPQLLAEALRQRRFALLALALELGVPPLAALAFVTLFALALLGGVAALGTAWPLWILGTSTGLATVGLSVAWWRFGRQILPTRELVRLPGYVLRKLPLYLGFISRPQSAWIRTQRDSMPLRS